jgi:penicillin G amidase
MPKSPRQRAGRFRIALLSIVLLPMMLAGVQATGQSREIAVQGLSAKLDITVDRWGIPHISAGSVNDAFFGQGYAAAMMRLWQLDITHRRQLGRLAEVFGPNFVPYDRAARPNGADASSPPDRW